MNRLERWAPKLAELKKMISFAFVTNSASAMIEVRRNGAGIVLLPSCIGRVVSTLASLELPEVAPVEFRLTYKKKAWRLPRKKNVLEGRNILFEAEEAFWLCGHFIHPNRAGNRAGALNPFGSVPPSVG